MIEDPESVLLLLKKTRALIEAGWTQGFARVRRGNGSQYCIIGALNQSYEGPEAFHDAQRDLKRSIPSRWAMDYGRDLVIFNDAHRRTQKDVLNLIDTAMENVMKGTI